MAVAGHRSDAREWPRLGRHPIVGVRMPDQPIEFRAEITLTRSEVFDVVALCEEAVELAEAGGQAEIAFAVEGVRRFLLGRLTGCAGGVDE